MSNKDIMDDGALEAGQCMDAFIRDINSHITGACMIPIKLPKKETIKIVQRAVQWFYKNYEDSVQSNYYIIDKANYETTTFKKSRMMTLPGPRPDGSGRIFSVNNLIVAGENMAGASGSLKVSGSDFSTERLLFGGSGNSITKGADDLMYYVVTEKFFDLARHVLVNRISFEYNRLTRNLKILGEKPNNHLVLEVYETIPDCALFQDEIFFRYVAAHVKKAIGTMIMMFGYSMPGNVTLNGDMIRDDANDEITEIKEDIKGDEGVDWFMTS